MKFTIIHQPKDFSFVCPTDTVVIIDEDETSYQKLTDTIKNITELGDTIVEILQE